MTVEFVGLSGSGKSTAARELVASHGFTVVKVKGKKELLRLNFLFFLAHPIFYFVSFLYIVANSGSWKMFYYKFTNLFLVHNAKHQKAKKYRRALIDQGHFQNALSLFEGAISRERLLDYIDILPKPDKLIVFNIPFVEADRRKESDGGYARSMFGKQYLELWKKSLVKNFNLFRKTIKEVNSDSFFIDATKPKGDVIQDILQATKRKKIIYLANARIPTQKAHGGQIIKMCEAFSSLGHYLELWAPRRLNPIKEDPFSYYGAKKNFKIKKVWNIDFYPILSFPRQLAFLIQGVSFLKAAIFLLLSRGYKGKSYIFYSRDYVGLFGLALFGFKPIAEIHDYRTLVPKWSLSFVFRRARKIVTNSSYTRDRIIEHYNIPKEKFLVAANAVDLDFFNIAKTKEEARKELSIPKDKTVIAYIGRLETTGKEKGVGDLISAFNTLNKENKDILLYVIGGPKKLIEKYKKETNYNKSAIFTGQISHNLIPLYLRAIDIVVIPFPNTEHYRTSSPIKVFEFMGAGKAIVASNISSLKESLGDSAVFFEAGNNNDLTNKLDDLIKNGGLIKNLEEKVFMESKKHSWAKRANNIISFIN